jgi:Ca2+-binding RTX toxin-like protein
VSVESNLPGGLAGIIGSPLDETIEGTDTGEWIFGTDADDVIDALGGDDFVQALAGDDTIDAGDGNDTILAGEGDDTVEGGAGDDVARGDAGADTFLFNPAEEGNDIIVDFRAADNDVVALSAAGLAEVGIEEFSGAALDESDAFNLVEDEETGDLVIEHPGGTITLNGVPFAEEGAEPPTFAALEEAGLLEIQGLVQGTDAGEELTGTDQDDVIDALGGDDTITPLSGDDIIATGEGRDTVNIDPSNANEGADTITGFSAPSELDPTAGDYVNFALADLLEADPDLPAADGDASSLSLDDFDASENWTLGSSDDGNLLLTHPGGSVEFTNAVFSDQTFTNLASVIKVDGEEFSESIPVDDGTDGNDGTDGTDGTDGGDETDGETDGGTEPDTVEPTDDAIA